MAATSGPQANASQQSEKLEDMEQNIEISVGARSLMTRETVAAAK